MIEITIPLNLPVRAVVATESSAHPPAWLAAEIERRSQRRRNSLSKPEGSPKPQAPPDPSTQELREQLDREIAKVRSEQVLYANAANELRRVTQTIQQQTMGLVQEFQVATVELAHAIASKLVFEEIEQDRFPIGNLVHEMIDRLETTTDAVVRLHPADLAQMGELPLIDGSNPIRFLADESLSRGDCKAKAGEIQVIYQLRRQIEELRRHLLSTVNGHAET